MRPDLFAIRRAYAVPLGIDAVLLLTLWALSLHPGGEKAERWLFALFALPAVYLFLESLIRRVELDDEGLRVRTLWRRRSVLWREITHVGALTLPRKVYLLLTTTRGMIILSNAYGRFGELTGGIVARVEAERVEAEVRALEGRPAAGVGQILLAWVAAALLTGLVVMKLFPAAL